MNSNIQMPSDVSIITTYRCQMRCKMCNIWQNPSDKDKEITPQELEMLPNFKFVNITGGEPFLRDDLEEIVEVMFKKAPRIVISTSGYHTDRILKLARRFPNIGIRVSIEGMAETNNYLRGREDGYERGLKTLSGLKELGVKDIGFGMTVSDKNSQDLMKLYDLAKTEGLEFATASFHNSYYFHKEDNMLKNKKQIRSAFEELIHHLLKENHPKSWFRAFFNLGLINYVEGQKRMLPCEAGTVNFFIDPYGEVYPCNGLEDKFWKESMGNIRQEKDFKKIWYSEQAEKVRALVRKCPKNCWMVGTAAPVMKKYIKHPLKWVVKNKVKSLLHLPLDLNYIPTCDVGQDSRQGDLREKI